MEIYYLSTTSVSDLGDLYTTIELFKEKQAAATRFHELVNAAKSEQDPDMIDDNLTETETGYCYEMWSVDDPTVQTKIVMSSSNVQ